MSEKYVPIYLVMAGKFLRVGEVRAAAQSMRRASVAISENHFLEEPLRLEAIRLENRR